MRAGTLDQLITIESRADTVNGFGQSVPTWSIFAADVPAAYEPARGREYFAAQALTVAESARFRIRWLSGVVAGQRVQYDGKIWDIAAVEEMYRRQRETHLYCSTGLTLG